MLENSLHIIIQHQFIRDDHMFLSDGNHEYLSRKKRCFRTTYKTYQKIRNLTFLGKTEELIRKQWAEVNLEKVNPLIERRCFWTAWCDINE